MNKSPKPFDRYLELLPKFVVRYGEERRWSPIQINKTFLLLMVEELGIIPTFSLHRRRVVSVTQQILHRDYSNETILTDPTELETPIRINKHSDLNVLEKYEDEIDTIYDSLKEGGIKPPYVLDSDKIKKKIQKIGESKTSKKERIKHIEKRADKIENLITNCKRLDYIHPKLENKDIQTRCEKLDSLPRLLKDLKNKLFETEEPNNDYLAEKIKDMFKKSGKLRNIKMTESHDSLLKKGSIDFVMNFRYLEFLRLEDKDNGEHKPIILSKNGDNFIIALGKNTKEDVPSSWAELYIFTVNGKNEEEVKVLANELEQFVVALIAEKFRVPQDWEEEIIKCSKNLKKVFPVNDIITEDLGEYGGEVYAAMLSISDETVNFPMPEEEVGNYIKKLIALVNKAVSDPDINNSLRKEEELQNLIKNLHSKKDEHIKNRLRFFEKEVGKIYEDKKKELPEIIRPLYLGDILEKGINCEGFASLMLYLFYHNRNVFHEIKQVKICCVTPDILSKYSINSHSPHIFLIFNSYGSQEFFDPTGVLDKIKSSLGERTRLYTSIESRGCFVEIGVPELTGEKCEFNRILKDEGLFIQESNFSSSYCLLTSLKNRDKIKKIENFVGFVVYIPNKHLDAGMPSTSIIGSTIRRLLVGLSRNPNVRKIVFLKNEEEDSKEIIRFSDEIVRIIEGIKKADEDVIREVFLRGRMSKYGIMWDTITKEISRIEVINADISKIGDLEAKIIEEAHSMSTILLPNKSNFLSLYPKYVDVKFFDNARFNKVRDLYEYAEWMLLEHGKKKADWNNLERIFISTDFDLEFSATLTGYDDLDEFLKEKGIENPEKVYEDCVKKGIFGERLDRLEMGNRREAFCTELKHAIENNKLGFTKSLFFVTEKETKYNETQVGWFSIDAHIDKDEEGFAISFLHKLRSVDLHDGFPFNIYFCVRLSEEIIKLIEDSIKKKIRLGKLKIEISYLHTYLDNFPKGWIKNDR
ncbi:hypothetical protein LR013_02390 [candidate division NPL-UPA2 bacterium]|nr:hypothetical protein [candidate division NPL-UPA2 bacterium]